MEPQAWLDREEAAQDRLLNEGHMTEEEHAIAIRLLRREYREMAHEEAERARETELDRWNV
jgi:hypothetical protein